VTRAQRHAAQIGVPRSYDRGEAFWLFGSVASAKPRGQSGIGAIEKRRTIWEHQRSLHVAVMLHGIFRKKWGPLKIKGNFWGGRAT
jgi:hypothetical protein